MTQTHMAREVAEIPAAARRLLGEGRGAIEAAAADLRDVNPAFVSTVARGSSDHAATYLKYACELSLGLPVASIGPSVASIFGARLKLGGAACFSISQSGQSPDIVAMAQAASDAQACTLAITNQPDSPLARASRNTVPIMAGPELSVAATKTFVTSALAGLAVLAHWGRDDALIAAIDALPDQLEAAARLDWSPLRDALLARDSMYVLGRGPSYAMACEAALKFKETCGIHAEAYSSAEVLHGPVEIVGGDYPVLVLAARDAAEPAAMGVAEQLATRGAQVFATSDMAKAATRLPFVATSHPLTEPLALITGFYAFIEQLARARGRNPDTPANLRKVTETT